MPDIHERLGERLRARRRKLGLTLEDLGAATGLHGAYIGQLERGLKKCSVRVLVELASALELGMAELFDEQGRVPAEPAGRRLSSLLLSARPKERPLIVATVRHLVRGLRKLR